MSIAKTILALGFLLLTSCGAIKESEDDSKGNADLKEYEASFRPSEYDQPVKDFFPKTQPQTSKDTSGVVSNLSPQSQELIQGYRVQLFATTGYDEITKMKGAVESQFLDELFYIVYDAPTYKLRAGNFLERYEADRFAKAVAGRGYKDAWVVPERVYRYPPTRSSPNQDPGKQ